MSVLRYVYSLFKPTVAQPVLGRWALKHKCPSEEIVVFNANRDHCGDAICGNQEEYKKLVPQKTQTQLKQNNNAQS